MRDLARLAADLLHAPVLPGGAVFVEGPPLDRTLWSFRSDVWHGYVDFRDAPAYWTHWGWGAWRAVRRDAIVLTNGYDGYRHALVFDATGTRFAGVRSDGVGCAGERLYGYGATPRRS